LDSGDLYGDLLDHSSDGHAIVQCYDYDDLLYGGRYGDLLLLRWSTCLKWCLAGILLQPGH
jgi:hypothetical protein